LDFLRQLFGSGGFQPHGFCYLWNARLVWLQAVSDLLIALAYLTIPVTLLWFIRKRRDLPFSWIFVCFGVFIVACGGTHVMEIWNLWHANYWLAGVIKAVTAAASIVTALLLIRLVPEALDLPSPQQWLFANAALQKEVQDRREVELNLRFSESMHREQAELLELTHDAIFVRSLEKKILYWNRAAERLYGWQKEEARGKITHVAEDLIVAKRTECAIVRVSSYDFSEVSGRNPRGSLRERLLGRGTCAHRTRWDPDHSLQPLGSARGCRRKTAFVQAQKFEAIGQLAGGIAHDFNNMIGAIMGWSDIGMEETEEGARLRRHFQKIHQQAERAAALTRQLLAFARRQILEPRNIDLNQSFTETLNLLEKVIGSDIEIKTILAPSLSLVRAAPPKSSRC
jgi:PAS domain-containing protein